MGEIHYSLHRNLQYLSGRGNKEKKALCSSSPLNVLTTQILGVHKFGL